MKKILFIALLGLFGCEPHGIVSESDIQEAMEEAYFEGQKDALEGDISIKQTSDGCYVWTKSPWTGKDIHRKLIYTPKLCK